MKTWEGPMEEQTPFGKSDYKPPSYLEKVQSQLPALQLLMQMGWEYLTPEETEDLLAFLDSLNATR